MHKNFVEQKSSLVVRLHRWLAPLACGIILIAPIIRFSTNFGIIVDAVGLFLLIICVALQGIVRPVQYLDGVMLSAVSYLLVVVILSAIFVGTEMAFEKALGIFVGGCVFYIMIFAFNEAPDVRAFGITFIFLSFIFIALSFQKGLEAVYEKRLLFSFACAIAIFSIYFFSLTAKWWQNFFLIGLVIPFIYWGTMSGNRSLLLISVLTISFHYMFFHKKRLTATLIFLPSAAAFGFIYWYFFSDSVMIARILATSDVGLGREGIWAASFSGIMETFPMGAGINESYRYLPGFFWSHNILLELLLELGVFSIPILLVSVSITFLAMFSRKKEQVFFLMIFLICLLNFMKSFSLGDVRLLTLPLALLIITMRKLPNVGVN